MQKAEAKQRLEASTSKAAAGEVSGRLSPRLVKSLRTKLGLPQGKFASLLGVSLGSVVNWELGKMKPRPDMRTKILSYRGLGRREVKLLMANMESSGEKSKKDQPKPAAKPKPAPKKRPAAKKKK